MIVEGSQNRPTSLVSSRERRFSRLTLLGCCRTRFFTLNALAGIAYKLLINDKFIFSQEDLKDGDVAGMELEKMGLVTSFTIVKMAMAKQKTFNSFI